MDPTVDDIVLAVIGDLHGELYHLKKVLDHLARERPAGILLVGDFGSPQYEVARWEKRGDPRRILEHEVERILALVAELEIPVAWVPGNHDEPGLDFPGKCDRRLVEVGGLRVYGLGGAGPGRFGFPYEWDEAEVRALDIPVCDVILSHAPPARTRLDKLFHADQHVGSEAVREIAEGHGGALVCGHIHEAGGVEQIGECLCLNVGSLGDPYGMIQVGLVTYSRWREAVIEVTHHNLLTGRTTTLAK